MKATTKKLKTGKQASNIEVPADVKRFAGEMARNAGLAVFVTSDGGVYMYGFEFPAGKTAVFVYALCRCNKCNPPTPTRRRRALAA